MEYELIKRCVAGDQIAFQVLYKQYAKRIRGICVRIVGDSDADDLVQETFLNAWRGISRCSFEHEGKFFAWLARIATNRCFNRIRARNGRRETELLEVLKYPDESLSSFERTSFGEVIEHLESALSQLSEEKVRILRLRSEGYEYREISEIEGIALGTVMSRLHRARMDLKAVLEENSIENTQTCVERRIMALRGKATGYGTTGGRSAGHHNRKAARKTAVSRWRKDVISNHANTEIGSAEIDALMPETLGASGDRNLMIRQAVKVGSLVPIDGKSSRWHVVASDTKSDHRPGPVVDNSHDDPGTISKVPDDKSSDAREAVFDAISRKDAKFIPRWVQENIKFFSAFTWGAIGSFLSQHRYNKKPVFEKVPNIGYRLTAWGKKVYAGWKTSQKGQGSGAGEANDTSKKKGRTMAGPKPVTKNYFDENPDKLSLVFVVYRRLAAKQSIAVHYETLRDLVANELGWHSDGNVARARRLVVLRNRDLFVESGSGKDRTWSITALGQKIEQGKAPSSRAKGVAKSSSVAALRRNLKAEQAETKRLRAELEIARSDREQLEDTLVAWLGKQIAPLPDSVIQKLVSRLTGGNHKD
ncbi:RNA polymerase sigma factor [Candidatus Parcubacteria bacterium]|jgi:RNA polymerase sigma-70 factor, ECF subfamily|nr:RNA polymerase sigma factor [Candidatus Parcubacteria bacterium]